MIDPSSPVALQLVMQTNAMIKAEEQSARRYDILDAG